MFFLLVLVLQRETKNSEYMIKDTFRNQIVENWNNALYRTFVPEYAYSIADNGCQSITDKIGAGQFSPFYRFCMVQERKTIRQEENHYLSLQDILLEEARGQEEVADDVDGIEENKNQEVWDTLQEQEATVESGGSTGNMDMDYGGDRGIEDVSFIPHQKLVSVDLQEYSTYEALVKGFYAIDKNTMVGSDQLNLEALLGKNLAISKEGDGPQILIYHTHSQEGFADSVPGDTATTIVGVGEYLTNILQEQYGYRVLHHIGQYDVEARDDAYSKSLPAIQNVLKENPSIQVIIDLHRDEMAEATRLVTDLDGQPTARFMFFNGLSRTRKTGDIAYLYNENQAANLAFSFQMQLKAMEYYPGLTRKIYLKGYRYNMHLKPRTLLIELGAQNNTVEEAMNACKPLAHILDMVLSGQ